MVKGDDHLQKKRSKATRKRQRRAGADSLEAIRGVQAAKRRRKKGTRRACEGMCYTLPTPDDPFNDRNDRKRKRKENRQLRLRRVPEDQILEFEADGDTASALAVDGSDYEKNPSRKRQLKDDKNQIQFCSEESLKEFENPLIARDEINGVQLGTELTEKQRKEADSQVVTRRMRSLVKKLKDFQKGPAEETLDAVILESRLLRDHYMGMNCSLRGTKERVRQKGSMFGQQCLEAFAKGEDVVASSSFNWDERAIDCAILAAVHIKLRQCHHNSLCKPVALIVVASGEQALQVRRIHKNLKKTVAISSVCVHTGTSVESQTEGFRSCTPDIVIATPQRLLELVQLKAVLLTAVSFLVIDGLDDIVGQGFGVHLTELRSHMTNCSQMLIISNNFSRNGIMILRELAAGPIVRVVSDHSVERRSACIIQEVSVWTSEAKRVSKLVKILQQSWEKWGKSNGATNLVLVENAEAAKELLPIIGRIGFVTASLFDAKDCNVKASILKKIREGTVQTLVTMGEFLDDVPLDNMQLVINYSFPPSIKDYQRILTGMARHSVHGELHSLCTPSMAHLASDLVAFLQTCSEDAPRSLRMLVDAFSFLKNERH